VSISQYNTKDVSLSGGFTVDAATINLVKDTVNKVEQLIENPKDTIAADCKKIVEEVKEVYKKVDERNDKIIAGAVELKKQGEVIVEKTGNLVSYGEFGLDTDSNVLNAKFQRMWESEEVQKVLLAYNDEGNTTTSYSAYLKNNLFITTDENGEPTIGHKEVSFMGKQITREDVEIAIQRGNLSVEEANKLRNAYGFGQGGNKSDIIQQATDNFKIIKDKNGTHYETEINGVKIYLDKNSTNTKEKIAQSDPQLWDNITKAVYETKLNGIRISSVMHNLNEPHIEGRGADITGFYINDNNKYIFIPAYKNYDATTGEWDKWNNKIENLNKTFDENFLNKPNSIKVLGPDMIIDKIRNENYKNLINTDKYKDVGAVNDRGFKTDKFDVYVQTKGLDKKNSEKLKRNYKHTGHKHVEIGK